MGKQVKKINRTGRHLQSVLPLLQQQRRFVCRGQNHLKKSFSTAGSRLLHNFAYQYHNMNESQVLVMATCDLLCLQRAGEQGIVCPHSVGNAN